ncbi:HypC/HybG/HupF family hydrogenase formation chaperone [Chitinibacter sp. ZOR0017]|jgi:hydrogenase expression/formation protein HypC|uniref:HypC/HybG/HupF family hydrogenase formation chaperone n=1 Tax=Chitinibacter sp. ZOR0017 TaxID=1339254 RepID=UPI00064710A5|nr:HypC/HybG/HupF family hydrogenase formation chaperone [Chitinibacter sp. ZOR0017]
MCLAIPARVTALLANDEARIEVGGVHKVISIALVDEVAVGDYLIVHVGFAIGKLDPAEAEQTLALFAQMAQLDPTNPAPYQ